MLFNSMHFLLFFPAVALLYFVLPHKVRWMWLLVASYFFYMSWNVKYALFLAASTVITYLSGLLIGRANKLEDGKRRDFQRKLWVALSVILNLSMLLFFKYFDFAIYTMNRVFQYIGVSVLKPSFDVILPVGISFYTFQALTYTIDVYRGESAVEKNPARYALFVSFFPLMISGPIERSKNLLAQFKEKHIFDYNNVKNGLIRMAWGYFQKAVIADRIAVLVNQVFDNYQQYSGFYIVIAAVLFAIQLYCDFSAYSDIAIGAAQIMGFRVKDNFRQPYFAKSIQEFWRRWHISLSTWFRDYLYIPLGGSRCSKLKKYRNVMITFLVSGLWHGSSWNFAVWGGLHGLFQIIGDLLKKVKVSLYGKLRIKTEPFSFRLGQAIVTFILVDFAWIFFRAAGITAALGTVKNMFSAFNPWIFFDGSLYELGLDHKELLIAVAAIVLLFVVDRIRGKRDILERLSSQNAVFRWSLYFVLIISILVFGVYGNDYVQTQFIYFQF